MPRKSLATVIQLLDNAKDAIDKLQDLGAAKEQEAIEEIKFYVDTRDLELKALAEAAEYRKINARKSRKVRP